MRCQGYVAGLRDAGPPVRPERVVRTERVTFASGAAAARALLGQAPDTDAVFALGDALAPGALRGLHDVGRVVPDDTAVAGFANVAQAAFSTPALTTVGPGREELAGRAVSLLTELTRARAAGCAPASRPAPHRRIPPRPTGPSGVPAQ
ncbi:substrate-binding domain-containing protein [Streptomyces olivaceus]|nr:substrate-binding domain-containing protein [Streptomyces olivaceus]